MRRFCALGVSGAALMLAGCSTLGGNIKGSFSCAAPDGICAPSSVIDDSALAAISGDVATPAGPYREPLEGKPAYRTVAAGQPARTRERVLRIVFQPYIDDRGRLHERSAVHAVVERGDWQQQALAGSSEIPAQASAQLPTLQVEPLADAVERAELSQAALAPAPAQLIPPDPAVVAAARERSRDPIAAIKSEVSARLSSPTDRRTPAPTDATGPKVSEGVGKPAEPAPKATVRAGSFPATVAGDE